MATGRLRVDLSWLLLILAFAVHDSTANHSDNETQVRCAWAHEVYDISQSQFSHWVAQNGFLGSPDYYPCPRNNSTEWFKPAQSGTLKLRFPKLLFVHRIDIYETLGAGSVVKITAITDSDHQSVLWQADGPELANCSRIFSPTLEFLQFPVDTILLEINTTLTSSIEIDGVRIHGRPDIPLEIRLVNGSDVSNGVVQVYSIERMTWGHVCGDHWRLQEADALCRQLGYVGADAAIIQQGVTAVFHVAGVNCTGSEMDITECDFNDNLDEHSCPEKEAAGVACTKDIDGPRCNVPHIANSSSTCIERLCDEFGDGWYSESRSTSYSYSYNSFYSSTDSYDSDNFSDSDGFSGNDNDSSSTSSIGPSDKDNFTDSDGLHGNNTISTSLSSTSLSDSDMFIFSDSDSLSGNSNDSSSTSSTSLSSTSFSDNDNLSDSLSSNDNDSSSTSGTTLSSTIHSDSDSFSDSGGLSGINNGSSSTSSSSTSSTSRSSTSLSDIDSVIGSGNSGSTAYLTLTSSTPTTNFPTEPSSIGFTATARTVSLSVTHNSTPTSSSSSSSAADTNGRPKGCDTFLDTDCSQEDSFFYSTLEPRYCGDWRCTIHYQESALSIFNGSLDASSIHILHVNQYPVDTFPSVHWCALNNEHNQWLELNFERMVGITKLTFVEFGDSPGWMRSFVMSFTADAIFWQYYLDTDRHPKEFDFNADSTMWDDEVTFVEPFEARAIRIHPREWRYQNICTTVTVWGYNMTGARELGVKNNEIIFDSQMEVSESRSDYTASDARLDSPTPWCANTSLGSPVFNIDLLVETSVTGILVQGRDSDQSEASINLTSFLVRLTTDSQHWKTRSVSGIDLQNGESFRLEFNKPVLSNKIKLKNFIWEHDLCLRFELLGSLHISNLMFADFEDTVPLWQEESNRNNSWLWFRIGDVIDEDDITDGFNSSFIYYDWWEGASECLSSIQSLHPETTSAYSEMGTNGVSTAPPTSILTYSELGTEGVSTAPPTSILTYSELGTEGVSTAPPTSILTMLATDQPTSPQPPPFNPFYACVDESSQSPFVSRLLFKEFQEGPSELVVRLRYLVRGASSDTRLEVKAIDADDVETTVWEKEAELEGNVQRGHIVYTIKSGTQIIIQATIARDDFTAFIALDDVGVYKGLTQPTYRRLGMNSKLFDITSNQLSASTVRPPDPEHGDFNVDNARIEIVQGAGAWCPDYMDNNIWFQVDYDGYIELHGIAIQGRASQDEWVTRFLISHSMNGTEWTTEGSAGDGDMIFVGSYDRNTLIHVLLDEPVVTRFVRILPFDWHDQPCLRIELIGYKDGNLPTNKDTVFQDVMSQESTTPRGSMNGETTPSKTTHSGTVSSETTDPQSPNLKESSSKVTGSGLTRSEATLFETTSSETTGFERTGSEEISSESIKSATSQTSVTKTPTAGTTRSGKNRVEPDSTPQTDKSHPHTQMIRTPPPLSEEEAQEKISTASDVEDIYSALMSQEGAVTSKTAKLALQAVSSLTQMESSSPHRGGHTETVTKTLGAVSSAAGQDKETAEEFLKVCDSLFNENSTASLQTPDNEAIGNSSSSTSIISSFLYVVDNFAASVTENLLDENTTEVTISTDNLLLQSWSTLEDRVVNDFVELTPNSSKNNFAIPASLVVGKQAKATAIVFKTLHTTISSDVEGQNSNGSSMTGSEVISLTLSGGNGSSIAFSEESPMVLSFQLEQTTSSDYEAECCFWKYTNNSIGGTWSTEGCRVYESSTDSTVCHCEHLTNFAVLLQLKERVIPAVHSMALDILTYVGAILSITSLLAAIFLFCFLRLLKSQRVIIHVNLAASLAAAQLLYLTSIGATSNKGVCKAIAALLHYLFTASFLWMLIEGVHLYTKSVAVFGKGLSTKIYILTGWGIPMVIVGIALGVRFDGYGTDSSCWLSLDGGLIYAFVTPVLVVVAVNTLILVMVIRVFITLKANTDKTEKERIRAGIRAVLLLQPLLGFTWIFGLFSSFDETLFFTYLFVIFNSSQGVFIFLLHCVGDYEVKKAVKKLRGRRTVSSSTTDYSVVQPSKLTRKQTMPTMVAQSAPSTSRPASSETHAQKAERNEPHLTAQKRESSKGLLSSKEAWGSDRIETREMAVKMKSDVYAIQDSDRTYGVQVVGATPAGMPEVKTE